MEYLVCRDKESNELFITTRASREAILKVLFNAGQQPLSNVLRSFDTYSDAQKYFDEQLKADKIINTTLKK